MGDITEEVYMGKCEVWGQKFRKYHFEGQERDNNSLNTSKKGQSWRNQEKRNLRTITVRDFKESGIGNEVTTDYGSCFGGVLVEINWIISQKYFFFLFEGRRERNTGDWVQNPGIWPDLESNQRPFGVWDDTQATEPYQQPGHSKYFKTVRLIV